MSKLFKLKKWLTLTDAAKYLATVFGERVDEADVLRLALDGGLKLSVHLVNGSYGRPCVPVNIDEIVWNEIPALVGDGILKIPKGGRVWQDENGTFQVFKAITELEDEVWDLPMIGGEKIDVEYEYQQITNGPEITTVSLDGVFVASSNGDFFEIQSRFEQRKKEVPTKPFLHPDNFHPAGGLPDDCVFVVRTDALANFIQSVDGAPTDLEKPLATRERDTLLKLVIGMAVDGYGHDPAAAKSNVPKEVADILANLGMSVSDDTVRKYLKQAADTVLPAKPRQP